MLAVCLQALCVVEAMALSDLRQLLLRPSRYSNEEVSLVQALGAACQSAAQLLPALHQQHMEQQAQLGAAAGSSSMDTDEDGVQQQQQQQLEACCRLAGALEHCWLQVQVRPAEREHQHNGSNALSIHQCHAMPLVLCTCPPDCTWPACMHVSNRITTPMFHGCCPTGKLHRGGCSRQEAT